MKPKSLILLTALILTAFLCAAPVAADAVTHNGKTYNTYDEIYASTTLSSAEKLALIQEMAGWTEELEAYMEWKNSGGLEAYQAAVSGGNSTSSDYGWDEAPGDGLGDGGTSIEPEYSYQERQAYDAAYEAYLAEFAENYAATAAYTGSGSGTESDPYIITTPAQLQAMGDDLSGYYQLANDIDMSGFSWSVIGATNTPFTGNLDGAGHTITGLNNAIFDTIQYATIKNLELTNSVVITNSNCGGFAHTVSYSEISNCVLSDSSISGSFRVGGIIGGTEYTTIVSNCIVARSSFSASYYNSIGAIVGQQTRNSEILNCVAYECTITGTGISANDHYAGGISGGQQVSGNKLTNVVFLSDSINAKTSSARISGDSSGVTITNAYALDSVLVLGSTTTGTTTSVNGQSITSTQATSASFYEDTVGFDFNSIWYWDSTYQWQDATGSTYYGLPQLQVFKKSIPPTISTITATPSIGGQQDTYTLSVSATTEAAGGIASYQWYGRIGSSGEWQAISGATAATYQFVPGDQALGDIYFKAVVTGADGGVVDSYDAGYTDVKITIVLAPQISNVAANPTTGPLRQTVQLSADVTSTTTATYQWQEQLAGTWTNIQGATSATYSVSIADTAATLHSYRLQATNIGGTTTSATVTYQSVLPPAISAVSATPASGPLTQTVQLSATVTGATAYQWQQQTGSTWVNIQGATSATYSVNIADTAATLHSYRLQATNIGGTTTSNPVTYQSVSPPAISAVSANPASGPLTQTVQLSVSATGAGSYQWQEQIGGSWTAISGATSATVSVNIADNAPTLHTYRVIVTGIGGTATSESVTYQSSTGPLITAVSATPASGPLTQTVQLSVSAVSENPITYQWQEQLAGTWTNIQGATAATYSVSIADTVQTVHTYRALATDVGGTTPSSTVSYSSIAPPQIQGANINPAIGKYTETITLSAEVTGADSYQWQQLVGNTWTNINGATTNPWVGTQTVTGDTQYRLQATNAGGTTSSAPILYIIAGPANIQSLTATPSVVAIPGSTTLQITGTNIVSVEWQKLSGATWQTIGTGVSLTESITNVGETTFRALVEGADGTTTTSNNIIVLGGYAPTVNIISPIDSTQFPSQSQINLSATVTGTDVTYQWDFGSPRTVNGGNTNPTWVTYLVDGQYTITLRAESIFGSTSDSVTIVSGVMPRPMATDKLDSVSTAPMTAFVESFNVPQGEIIDLPAVFGSLTAPMSDLLPDGMFMVIVFGVIFIMLWIMTKNTAVPSIIGLIFGGFILALLPANYYGAAVAILAISIVGGVIRVFIPPK